MNFRVCVCLLMLGVGTLAAGQQKVVTFHSNGAFANIDTFNNGNTFGSLFVTRDGTGSNAQTNLVFSFTVFDSNFNVITSSFGFGTIPSSSFQGDGIGQMSLDLDFSTAADYSLCTFTPNTGTTCASPGQGTINLTWKQLDLFSFHNVENLIQKFPGVTVQSNGTQAGSGASVQGTIFGTTLLHYNASIGSEHGSTHSVSIP